MEEENKGWLFTNTRSTVVFVVIAVLVIAGLGLLYWANKTGKIKIFGSESQIENTYEIFFNSQATFDQYKESANNIKFVVQSANPNDPNFINGGGYFELDNIDFNLSPGTNVNAQYITNDITPQQDNNYKLTNISYAPQNSDSVKVYFQNPDNNWQLYSTGQSSMPTPVKIKVVLETQVYGEGTIIPALYNLKLTFTKESVTPTPEISPSPSSTPSVSASATVTTSATETTSTTPTPESSQTPQESATSTVTITPTETASPALSPSPTPSPTQSCTLSGKVVNKNDSESYINNASIKIDGQQVAVTENGIFSVNLASYLTKDTVAVKFEAEGFDTFEQTLNALSASCTSSSGSIIWSISLNPSVPVITPTPTPVPSTSETPSEQNDIKYTIDKMEVSKELELSSGEKANFTLFKNNDTHSLELISVANTSAQVKISSGPITLTLVKNETKYIDIDNDNQKEFRLRLNSVENGKVNITYEQLLTVSFQSGLWLQNDAVAGSDFTVDTPGFDEGELITIVITDPDTKQVLLSQTGTVKNGKVTIKISGDMPTGNQDLTIKSNLVPEKLVSTGINIKSSSLWMEIGLGILTFIIVLAVLLWINKSKKKNK